VKPSTAAAAVAAILPLAFLVLGVQHAYPFVDNVSVPARSPDDWHTYKELALSVVNGGLSMPALTGTYANLPHGFLYVYFVALVFAVFGVNSSYVYVAQSLMLGLSISLTYVAFRRRLTPAGGLAFLLALTALMYVDVFRHLTFRLLSENLYFFLCPLFLLLLFRSIGGDSRRLEPLLAGVILGLILLARPNFTLSAALVIAVLFVHGFTTGHGYRAPVSLLLGTAVGVSGVAIRNYAATGHPAFDIVTNASDWLRPWKMAAAQFVDTYVPRSAFVVGWTGLMAPAYRPRPHWMIAWLLWAAYPALKLSRREPFELWETLLYVYVAGYIIPVLLVAADITSYGGRMIVTILPVVLVPAFRLLFPGRVESRP
jgi:Dolichyl-phosphate-mannose-protein mannosyltransferase